MLSVKARLKSAIVNRLLQWLLFGLYVNRVQSTPAAQSEENWRVRDSLTVWPSEYGNVVVVAQDPVLVTEVRWRVEPWTVHKWEVKKRIRSLWDRQDWRCHCHPPRHRSTAQVPENIVSSYFKATDWCQHHSAYSCPNSCCGGTLETIKTNPKDW